MNSSMKTMIESIFHRFALCYGNEYYRKWEGIDQDALIDTWARELDGSSPQALAWALDNLPDRPPNVFEFRAVARRYQEPTPLSLEGPKAEPERVRKAIDGIRARVASVNAPHGLQWAYNIIDASVAGRQYSLFALKAAKDVVEKHQRLGSNPL